MHNCFVMKFKTISILLLAGLLASCGNDEPTPGGGTAIQVKMEEDRTVLIGADNGKIYNMKGGSVYATLPGCTEISDMTMHGEDYYVTGKSTDGTMTYWMNGQAKHLDNNQGYTACVARSYDNIFVVGATSDGFWSVYKNNNQTNISSNGTAKDIAANADDYYAIGNGPASGIMLSSRNVPLTIKVGSFCTAVDVAVLSGSVSYYVSGYNKTVVNGADTYTPCFWIQGQQLSLPVNFSDREMNQNIYKSGQALSVSHKGSDIYIAGWRSDGMNLVPTVWITSSSNDTDDTKAYWKADGNVDAEATKTLVYGSDVYVMTVEHNRDTNAYCTRIWMNHELKGTVNGIVGVGFVVI